MSLRLCYAFSPWRWRGDEEEGLVSSGKLNRSLRQELWGSGGRGGLIGMVVLAKLASSFINTSLRGMLFFFKYWSVVRDVSDVRICRISKVGYKSHPRFVSIPGLDRDRQGAFPLRLMNWLFTHGKCTNGSIVRWTWSDWSELRTSITTVALASCKLRLRGGREGLSDTVGIN